MEQETLSMVRKVGGSLMLRIPKDLVKLESLQDGQLVKVKIKKVKKSFFGTLKGIGKFTKEDELDSHD